MLQACTKRQHHSLIANMMQLCGTVQVQATFAGGLQEHLQAAGGANAATAASLRESLGTSAQILSDLKSQKSETACCCVQHSCSNGFGVSGGNNLHTQVTLRSRGLVSFDLLC